MYSGRWIQSIFWIEEKKNHVNVSEIEAAVKKIMVIFLKVIIFGSYGMRCKWMLQEELMMFNLLIWRKT